MAFFLRSVLKLKSYRVIRFVAQLILDTVKAIVIVSTSASVLFETKIVSLSKKLIGKTHD